MTLIYDKITKFSFTQISSLFLKINSYLACFILVSADTLELKYSIFRHMLANKRTFNSHLKESVRKVSIKKGWIYSNPESSSLLSYLKQNFTNFNELEMNYLYPPRFKIDYEQEFLHSLSFGKVPNYSFDSIRSDVWFKLVKHNSYLLVIEYGSPVLLKAKMVEYIANMHQKDIIFTEKALVFRKLAYLNIQDFTVIADHSNTHFVELMQNLKLSRLGERGYERVFCIMNDAVSEFYVNAAKWEMPKGYIFPKTDSSSEEEDCKKMTKRQRKRLERKMRYRCHDLHWDCPINVKLPLNYCKLAKYTRDTDLPLFQIWFKESEHSVSNLVKLISGLHPNVRVKAYLNHHSIYAEFEDKIIELLLKLNIEYVNLEEVVYHWSFDTDSIKALVQRLYTLAKTRNIIDPSSTWIHGRNRFDVYINNFEALLKQQNNNNATENVNGDQTKIVANFNPGSINLQELETLILKMNGKSSYSFKEYYDLLIKKFAVDFGVNLAIQDSSAIDT